MGLQKNVAGQKWRVFAFNKTTNAPVTGDAANITAKIAKDWAAAAATNDVNPTEVEDGYYLFDLTQAESNADALDLYPESSTADVQVIGVPGTIFTTVLQTGDSFGRLGAPGGASVSADLADVPTVAEFNARTLAAAAYFDPAVDTVANVTTVGTTTTNTDMRGTDGALTDKAGFSLSTAGILAIWHQLTSAVVTAGTVGRLIKDFLTGDAFVRMGVAGANLNDLGGMSTGMKAEVNIEMDSALDTAMPGSPTGGSVNEVIKRLGRSVGMIQEYTVDTATFAPTITALEADLVDIGSLEATADHFNGRIMIFTSGDLIFQATDITDYELANSKAKFTYTALTSAPANNDRFIIV